MIEILQAINESSTKIQEQISGLRLEFDEKLGTQINLLRQEMREGFAYHEIWLNRIEKNMATKQQFTNLLSILEHKEVISPYESSRLAEQI